MNEQTLILIKPDGVKRRLIGEILARIEKKGLSIVALKLISPPISVIAAHYAEHEGRDYYPSLIEFISSGPVVAAVIAGENAIAAFRQIAGATDPVKSATPGSIRGDFGLSTQYNLVHGSDSPESAAREITLWFPDF